MDGQNAKLGMPFENAVEDQGPEANLTIVPAGSPDQTQGAHAFLTRPDVSITLPKEPGDYEIRYLTRRLPRAVYARKKLTIR